MKVIKSSHNFGAYFGQNHVTTIVRDCGLVSWIYDTVADEAEAEAVAAKHVARAEMNARIRTKVDAYERRLRLKEEAKE